MNTLFVVMLWQDGLSSQFSSLQVKLRDANFNGPLSSGRAEGALTGATASLLPPQATAEIEGDESEVVSYFFSPKSMHLIKNK